MSYTGYLITETSREKILKRFSPKYSRVICHHITEKFGVPSTEEVPNIPHIIMVDGYYDSGDGVEGLLVSVNGQYRRPDGNLYHITLSLNEGRTPAESNDYTEQGKVLREPFTIMVTPKVFT